MGASLLAVAKSIYYVKPPLKNKNKMFWFSILLGTHKMDWLNVRTIFV